MIVGWAAFKRTWQYRASSMKLTRENANTRDDLQESRLETALFLLGLPLPKKCALFSLSRIILSCNGEGSFHRRHAFLSLWPWAWLKLYAGIDRFKACDSLAVACFPCVIKEANNEISDSLTTQARPPF